MLPPVNPDLLGTIIITAIISSTASAIIGGLIGYWFHHWQVRPRILVKCNMAFGVLKPEIHVFDQEPETVDLIQISVINSGQRPILITKATLITNDGFEILGLPMAGSTPMPRKLEVADEALVLVRYSDLEQALWQHKANNPQSILISAIADDAEGNRYKGDLPRILKDRGLAK